MSKFDDYMSGSLAADDPWVAHGLKMGWLKPQEKSSLEAAMPVAQAPERKRMWGGGPVDTRTFGQYDPNAQRAKAQLETLPITQTIKDIPEFVGEWVDDPKNRILKNVAMGLEGGTHPTGVAATFAGVKAKTAPLEMLKKAQAMEAAGITDKQIWSETGWTKGFADKQWRFEIPDNEMTLNFPELQKEGNQVWRHGSIYDTVQHPGGLHQAYPEIGKGGYHMTEGGGEGSYVGGNITVSGHPIDIMNPPANKFKPTTLHELQHAVQEREGFARGGSPEAIQSMRMDARSRFDQRYALKDKIGELEYLIANKKVPIRESKARLSELRKQHDAIPWDKSDDALLRVPYGKSIGVQDDVGTFDAYRSLAGEAEARLTANRMNLTPEERRMRYPVSEFDVPVDKQIVRGVPGAVEQAYAKMRDPKSKAMLERQYPELKPIEVYRGVNTSGQFKGAGDDFVSYSTNKDYAAKYGRGASQDIKTERISPVNIFDYSNPTHIDRLIAQLEKSHPNRAARVNKRLDNVKRGSWTDIEDDAVRQTIKDAGFEGFFMLEDGIKNVGVFKK